jgi:hypothetical protein
VPDPTLLLLPVLGLVAATLVGAGLVTHLAPGLPHDVQAALAPLAGFALAAVASTLLPLGATTRPLALAVLALGALLLSAASFFVLRRSAVPLAVALGSIALAAVPSAVRGDWQPTSLYGSTDAYHWVSQGRAYLDGPAPRPLAEHPDRLAYERSREQHWAVALPFVLGALSWLAGEDPSRTYGALAAFVFALLPLATYAAARGVLELRPAPAALAAGAVALNASLLFASHFSWQQQLAGSALALAAAAVLRLGLEPAAARRTVVLAALLAAGALGTYRLGFAPYLAALLLVVLAAGAHATGGVRAAARPAGLFLAAAAALALPSLAAFARGFPAFVDSGGFSTAFKQHFPAGQPAEALGLVPRVWTVEEGWPGALRLGWLLLASAVAVALLAGGARGALRWPRRDFLLAGTALALGGWLLLLLPAFSPYLSYKLLSYGAPFLVLLALAGAPGVRRPLAAGAGCLLLASAAVATALAREARTPPAVTGQAPRDAVLSVTTDDPWAQAWALYRFRDVRLSVERPTYLLTAQGRERGAAAYRRRPVSHAVVLEGDRLVVRELG